MQTEKPDVTVDADMFIKPGELIPAVADPIELNKGRRSTSLSVTSLCDRPIQVGSHYHFLEANKYLRFDRSAAYGMRLVRKFAKLNCIIDY